LAQAVDGEMSRGASDTLTVGREEIAGTSDQTLTVHDEIVSRAAFLDALVELTKRPFGTFHRYAAIGGAGPALFAPLGAFG